MNVSPTVKLWRRDETRFGDAASTRRASTLVNAALDQRRAEFPITALAARCENLGHQAAVGAADVDQADSINDGIGALQDVAGSRYDLMLSWAAAWRRQHECRAPPNPGTASVVPAEKTTLSSSAKATSPKIPPYSTPSSTTSPKRAFCVQRSIAGS